MTPDQLDNLAAVEAGEAVYTTTLPNGCRLYRRPNGVGGHVYLSDEVGGGVVVWDTSVVADSTLLAALTAEATRHYLESVEKRKGLLADNARLLRVAKAAAELDSRAWEYLSPLGDQPTTIGAVDAANSELEAALAAVRDLTGGAA